ncbi:hypothetical protein BSP109_03358, partial [Brevibacterium sp. Mu109]
MNDPQLVATCWTSAGDAAPMRASEASPHAAVTRVRVAAETGWAGVGFVLDDLRQVRDTIGYELLAEEIRASGLSHVEVELCSRWWTEDSGDWRQDWADLLAAAGALDASFIKVGTEMAPQV